MPASGQGGNFPASMVPQEQDDCVADAGEGDDSPSPAPHPLTEVEGKLSGMPGLNCQGCPRPFN
jgi:hypothetical protein